MSSDLLTRPRPLVAVAAAGCLALLARPWALRLAGDPTALLFTGFVTLFAVGVAWPLPQIDEPQASAPVGFVVR